MLSEPTRLMPARILVVDDERQIHASIRLRLRDHHELVFAFDAREALEKIKGTRFDLCLSDIHMPGMDGLNFIAAAQEADPALGFVILSAFDSPDNLRRAIPLQVYDFLSKPLPQRGQFEDRITTWVERTRQRRRDLELARQAGEIADDRDAARLERDIELVASETARDVLQQAAGFHTTIQAHVLAAINLLGSRAKGDPVVAQTIRGLEEARKTTEAVMSITDGFFDSGYASRDTSPAVIDEGVGHAIGVASRISRAEASHKTVHYSPGECALPIRGLSGIDFLHLLVPAIGAALVCTAPQTTVGIHTEQVARLDAAYRESSRKNLLWLNRRQALLAQPAVAISIIASAPAPSVAEFEAWLNGDHEPLRGITARGLILGIQKCQGLLGAAVSPHAGRFGLVLVLPT